MGVECSRRFEAFFFQVVSTSERFGRGQVTSMLGRQFRLALHTLRQPKISPWSGRLLRSPSSLGTVGWSHCPESGESGLRGVVLLGSGGGVWSWTRRVVVLARSCPMVPAHPLSSSSTLMGSKAFCTGVPREAARWFTQNIRDHADALQSRWWTFERLQWLSDHLALWSCTTSGHRTRGSSSWTKRSACLGFCFPRANGWTQWLRRLSWYSTRSWSRLRVESGQLASSPRARIAYFAKDRSVHHAQGNRERYVNAGGEVKYEVERPHEKSQEAIATQRKGCTEKQASQQNQSGSSRNGTAGAERPWQKAAARTTVGKRQCGDDGTCCTRSARQRRRKKCKQQRLRILEEMVSN